MSPTPGQEFLELFRDLEQELCTLAKFKDSYVSFSRALNQVHYERLNPVVASGEVYEFLKTASDLRNLLSHRNDVAEPTPEFLARFRRIVSSVLYPLTCFDIATKGDDIMICRPAEQVKDVVQQMNKRRLSHIPVYDSDRSFLGVFSRTTFFEAFAAGENLSLGGDTRIEDLLGYIDINRHGTERYLFVSKKTSTIDVYQYLVKKKSTERRLSCIFVTKNGNAKEALLGVVTESDLFKAVVEGD